MAREAQYSLVSSLGTVHLGPACKVSHLPYQVAVLNNHEGLVQLLLESGADRQAKNGVMYSSYNKSTEDTEN